MDDDQRSQDAQLRSAKRKMWLLAMLAMKKETKFIDMLNDEGRRRRCRSLPRPALVNP